MRTPKKVERRVIQVWERSPRVSFTDVTRILNSLGVSISRPTVTRIIREHLRSLPNQAVDLEARNDLKVEDALRRRLRQIGPEKVAALGIDTLVERYFELPHGSKKRRVLEKILSALPPIEIGKQR